MWAYKRNKDEEGSALKWDFSSPYIFDYLDISTLMNRIETYFETNQDVQTQKRPNENKWQVNDFRNISIVHLFNTAPNLNSNVFQSNIKKHPMGKI